MYLVWCSTLNPHHDKRKISTAAPLSSAVRDLHLPQKYQLRWRPLWTWGFLLVVWSVSIAPSSPERPFTSWRTSPLLLTWRWIRLILMMETVPHFLIKSRASIMSSKLSIISFRVNGKEIPGPLFDFGLLMFHVGKALYDSESGPFFYLSKVESYLEARLWNDIFVWTERKLHLPVGTIKATVLIESILASFEMEEILYELREHSAGLNCGIWDYSASFVSKFGHRAQFLLPDRSKYVNMEKVFLKSYMDLLVQTCHRRGALATGGMAASLLPKDRRSDAYQSALATVTRLKLFEIKAGVDGFMVYDIGLVGPMQKLFEEHSEGPNQLHVIPEGVKITAAELLTMPPGGVTLYGLKHNTAVGILFIYSWLKGEGHFYYRGQVEDSATAEISRSQVWQWIRHGAQLEDDNRIVSRSLVQSLVREVERELQGPHCPSERARQMFHTATEMFLEIVQKRDFPEFITTYLNLDHTFLVSTDNSC
ncbi:malate synthase-like isoform X4 [Tachyglossus aculeatus]|uniref:malate synthase-like isoform X4 n=1 Tax=Tachyglossus aculeatus TaxID=9261 RepID=UPI0018F56F82|nr:malate synthase-like isoform X4 [Tachyglossus aculeatus]